MDAPTSTDSYKLVVRNLTADDYADTVTLMKAAYPDMQAIWSESAINHLIETFPDGQICVEDSGQVVGMALSIIVDYTDFGDNHTYAQITGNYSFGTHNPTGDVLYGIEVCVHPDWQGLRIGRRLYEARKEVCEGLNLRAIIAGGRMPGYSKHADHLTPREYIEEVRLRRLFDPVLTFQLSNGFHVRKILRGYLPYDAESKTHATLIEWNNVYYEQPKLVLEQRTEVVRIGLVQWQMRTEKNLDAIMEDVEFFVDAVSGYGADFVLFPEYFSAPLMQGFNSLSPPEAARKWAEFTPEILQRFVQLAVSYNINIITGSLLVEEADQLYNVAYLCRRDGTWEEQRKIHPTPHEVMDWGIAGGNEVKVFDTDVGKVGILICYDVEFPELARLLALEGIRILFVPFSTDTQRGYLRVRKCAEARAIENEIYVALAGSVGNLPKVVNMDLQYAQSAILSPSDFYFPSQAIIDEATPNAEMTVIGDVNLRLLDELHQSGSVRNLKDRRTDLYTLKWNNAQ